MDIIDVAAALGWLVTAIGLWIHVSKCERLEKELKEARELLAMKGEKAP